MPSRDAELDAGHPDVVDAELSREELSRRAKAGIFLVSTRGLALLLIGFVGNVVLARLLAPSDFGLVAIGTSFVVFTQLISDGGLGVGLIRRAEPPSREELGALSGLQLGLTVSVALAVTAVAEVFGRAGWICALMVWSMPLVALQLPGRILLERTLLYRRLVVVEISQVVAFYAWAIGTVLAGFGVLGLATATLVRAAVAVVTMAWACPNGLVRPVWAVDRIRPLLGFGIRFQAVDATWLVRDQVLNASIAAVGGLDALGLWVLARRLMELPYMLFHALWRVSFPTMSRLVAARENVGPLVERAVGIAAVGSGFLLTGLAGGAAGLIPGLFGDQWRGAGAVVPWACLGLGISACVSVGTQGYLYAIGDATSVLRSILLQSMAWFAVTLPLLPVLGVVSVGIGWLVASVVEALVLGAATNRTVQVRLVRPLLAPVLVGSAAALAGWAVDLRFGTTLWSGMLGAFCATSLFAVGTAIFARRLLRETCHFAADSVRAAVGHSRR